MVLPVVRRHNDEGHAVAGIDERCGPLQTRSPAGRAEQEGRDAEEPVPDEAAAPFVQGLVEAEERALESVGIHGGTLREAGEHAAARRPPTSDHVRPVTGYARRVFDVLGIGVATVDDFLRVPHLPAPDTKVRVIDSERACGGLCATALVSAARLGASVAYAGVLGTDDLSDFVLRSLEDEGVDTSHVDRLPDAGPGHSIIVVDPDGRRTVYSDPRRMLAGADDRPPASVIREARVLLVDHVRIAASIRAARIGRWEGIPVVADIERDDDPRLPELLALVDHLVVPIAFGERLTGASDPGGILAALRSPGRTTVLTAGAAGAWYMGPDADDRPAHRRAFEVDGVDTTGCGDAFHGAYAAGLAFGLDLAGRVRLANAVAALTATRLGGRAGIPDRTAVEAFLVAQPDPSQG